MKQKFLINHLINSGNIGITLFNGDTGHFLSGIVSADGEGLQLSVYEDAADIVVDGKAVL